MEIIIVGAGSIGVSVASRLSQDGHHITIIDINGEKLKSLDEYLDVKVIVGDCTSPEILDRLEVGRINLFIAVTGNDSFNVLACQKFKKMGSMKCIARLRTIGYFGHDSTIMPRDMGIDLIIHPEKDTADEIFNHLFLPSATHVESFFQDKVKVIGFKVKRNSFIVEKTLRELQSNCSKLFQYLILIRQSQKKINPDLDEKLLVGDHFFIAASTQDAYAISLSFRFEDKPAQDVFVGSGSNVSMQVMKKIEETSINAKVLEEDIEICRQMNHVLTKSLILQGSQNDGSLLVTEGIEKADFFLAISDNEEQNILSSLLAKKKGVRKSMALVFNSQYSEILPDLDIDVYLSMRLVSIDRILKFVLKGEVVSVFELDEEEVEVIEYRVTKNSVIVDVPLGSKDFSQIFPKEAMVSYILNQFGEVIIPKNGIIFSENDHVIVCSLAEGIPDLEKIFV